MTYRVHVCDDEPHIVLAVSLKLSKAGIQVSTANNGEDAWDNIQKERPQLLITDLQMPRLDGLDLIRRGLLVGVCHPFYKLTLSDKYHLKFFMNF